MNEADVSGLIKSVQKSLIVLKHLMNATEEVSLAELKNALGYNNSTIHHLLRTLMLEGFVSQNAVTKKYGLGPELFYLCIKNQNPQKFFYKAFPILEECVALTGETTNLFVRIEYEAVCVIGAESDQTLKAFLMIGRRIPLTCTAAGKVFLAYMDERQAMEIVDNVGLRKYLPSTITEREKLREELARVRQEGFAVEREEFEEMITALAVPVLDRSGELIAVVSNISPSNRTDIERNSRVLKETAVKVGQALAGVYY